MCACAQIRCHSRSPDWREEVYETLILVHASYTLLVSADVERTIKVFHPATEMYTMEGKHRFSSVASLRAAVRCSADAVLAFLDADGDWTRLEDPINDALLPSPLKLKWATSNTGTVFN
jgi:hypothetical protein